MKQQDLNKKQFNKEGYDNNLSPAGVKFDDSQLNTDVFNTVIAFKMIEIMRDNGQIDECEYAKVERKRAQYKGTIINQKKSKKGGDLI